jgi:succinate dehydrogenase / fumarate reductase flavoprotein subunit
MFPIAKSILKGALQRDECRGAHFKPDFAMPSLHREDPPGRKAEAEQWCDRFDANNQKWLKSTVVSWNGKEPSIQYQDVDTSLIEPRPRLYGLVGAEVIMEVWQARQAKKTAENDSGSADKTAKATAVGS